MFFKCCSSKKRNKSKKKVNFSNKIKIIYNYNNKMKIEAENPIEFIKKKKTEFKRKYNKTIFNQFK